MQPFRGTGWAAGQTPAGHGPAQYTGAPASAQPYYAGGQQPPPVYSPPAQQTQGYGYNQNQYGGANQGYFGGGQQTGVELEQPDRAYHPQRGGDNVYAPPVGAPLGKKEGDGIVK